MPHSISRRIQFLVKRPTRFKEHEGKLKPHSKTLGEKKHSFETIDFKHLKGRFPWAKERRVLKMKNFTLTQYVDGSRLYTFKNGGYMIMTPQGVALHKSDPQAIKRYLKGDKIYLRSGGNADIYLSTVNKMPIVLKEFRSGVSADAQMRHAREAKQKLDSIGERHTAPTYYGMAAMSAEKKRNIREIGAMEFINAKNVTDILDQLRTKGDSQSMKSINRLLNDYKGFKKTLVKNKVPLTDFDTANVLAKFDDKKKRYIFTLIDQ